MHLDGRGEEDNWELEGKQGEGGVGRQGSRKGVQPGQAMPVLSLSYKCSWLSAPCRPHLSHNGPSFLQNGVGGGLAEDPHALASWTQQTEGSQEEQICFPATPQFPTTLPASKVMSRSQHLRKELWCGRQS